LLDPNDTVDLDISDNEKELTVVVNTETERIPWRENFDGTKVPWVKVSDEATPNWEVTVTNYDKSMSYQAFEHSTDLNTQAWLVSPSLDFSRWSEASMTFDLSYRRGIEEKEENLEVYASADCGERYEKLSYTFDADDFEESAEAWTPATEDDWQKQTVALTTFAGLDEVRVAFVVTNRNGNNLYIDNVEFFTTTLPNTIEAKNPYSVYGYEPDNLPGSSLKVKFNLAERQTVRFSLVDMMGKTLSTTVLYDVLNQAYSIDTTNVTSSGVYIVYLLIGNKSYGTRIFIAR
jgi:hypothetical protein